MHLQPFTISRIKEILHQILFGIELTLVTNCKKVVGTFMQKPLEHLIKDYDSEVLKVREEIEEKGQITNMKHEGRCGIKMARQRQTQ